MVAGGEVSLAKPLNRSCALPIYAASVRGAIEGFSVFLASPVGDSLEPYLAPYGYLAVNETRVAAHSGRNVACRSQSPGKRRGATVTHPLTSRDRVLK